MRKKQILRGRSAMRNVYAEGRRIESRMIRCYFRVEEAQDDVLRVGFSVPSRNVGSVWRNRIRRLMREAFAREIKELSRHLATTHASVSLLFVYRPSATVDVRRLTLSTVHPEISRLCRMLRDIAS